MRYLHLGCLPASGGPLEPAGQRLSFNVISPNIGTSYSNCIVRIKDPSNSQITYGYCGLVSQISEDRLVT